MAGPTPARPLLVVTKGHPFEREAFFRLFDELFGRAWTHVEQPAATHLFDPAIARGFAAFVLYDLPGIRFRRDGAETVEPPEAFRRAFPAFLADGVPILALHHAIAGWPTFDGYAEALGARFFYVPGSYKGRRHASSGYLSGVRHRIDVVTDHPVTAGLGEGFEIEDELYLMEMLEADCVPLLASRARFERDAFQSAAAAVAGADEASWQHPPGTPLVAWTNRAGRSPVVVVQPGDGPAAWSNPSWRRLIANAVGFLAGEDARS